MEKGRRRDSSITILKEGTLHPSLGEKSRRGRTLIFSGAGGGRKEKSPSSGRRGKKNKPKILEG